MTNAQHAETAHPRRPVRIIHFGLGRFFRAHQAWYTTRAADAADWGIAAFTVRSPRAAEDLAAHGYEYTLVVRGPEADVEERVDSVVAAHHGSDIAALRQYAADPKVAVVTLTVTEAGYGLDAAGDPNIAHPDVRSDLRALRNGRADARTVLGRLVVALDARRRADAGPIAVVPCDNVPANGSYVGGGVIGFSKRVDPELGRWIRANVSFVNTSVDRITPRVPGDQVVTEPFSDWVLAGDFPKGRPRWESAGARFVAEIEPWENRKLWLLNGAHSILAVTGLLRGLDTVAEAIADPQCWLQVDTFWDEAVACLPADIEHADYRKQLSNRFANPRIAHRLSQIATDATSKVQFRIAAVAEQTLDAGRVPVASAKVLGEWIRWVLSASPASDARAAEIALAARAADPVTALVKVVSPRLGADSVFMERVRAAT